METYAHEAASTDQISSPIKRRDDEMPATEARAIVDGRTGDLNEGGILRLQRAAGNAIVSAVISEDSRESARASGMQPPEQQTAQRDEEDLEDLEESQAPTAQRDEEDLEDLEDLEES